MTPEEKFEQETWRLLQKIKEKSLFCGSEEVLWKQSNSDSFDFENGEDTILKNLEKSKAISLEKSYWVSAKFDPDEMSTHVLHINIKKAAFDKIYKEYENKFKHKVDKSDNGVSYEFMPNDKRGYVHFLGGKSIEISEESAKIIYYLYEARKIDGKYKSYHDYNETFKTDIKSGAFTQAIIRVNHRVKKGTKEIVKKIICEQKKSETSPKQINRFRWEVIV